VSWPKLRRFLAYWAVFLVVLLVGVQTWAGHGKPSEPTVVRSWWISGRRVAREVRKDQDPPTEKRADNARYVDEEVTGESPIVLSGIAFDVGLVPGLDGVKATLNGKTAYATVDDLMSRQAYDRGHLWVEASFGWGVQHQAVLDVLAEQLGVSAEDVLAKASFRRVRMVRHIPNTKIDHIEEKDLTRPLVMDAMKAAATHLARACDAAGRFRYMIDAPTNVTLPGYNWPRHAGATFFLAQAAGMLRDPMITNAALRAGGYLQREMMRPCGTHKCITEDQPVTEVGSSALALIAFTEFSRQHVTDNFKPQVAELAAFLKSQQRPDGELMHLYDRQNAKPIDQQFLYYSGEATLGLARAHTITNDPSDLEAAKRMLSRISGSGWAFFGSRYYFSEEHWTCQAVAELWDRAPDRDALAFCSRWHEYQRRLQYSAADSPFDADGAFGFGPIVSPRVTPASSRGEAAGALLAVLLREPERHASEIPLATREFQRALAFVLRSQFHPGPDYLFAQPVAVVGALPGSPVDWQLRIDYAQHAGCMMVRWLELNEMQHKGHDGAAPSLQPSKQ
jgi:hypothetical protein